MNPIFPETNHPTPLASEVISDHPLAAIAGQFEGEVWEATLEEIQRRRRLDRKQWQQDIKLRRSHLG
jgi:phospholipase/lecithinase/hemolysin